MLGLDCWNFLIHETKRSGEKKMTPCFYLFTSSCVYSIDNLIICSRVTSVTAGLREWLHVAGFLSLDTERKHEGAQEREAWSSQKHEACTLMRAFQGQILKPPWWPAQFTHWPWRYRLPGIGDNAPRGPPVASEEDSIRAREWSMAAAAPCRRKLPFLLFGSAFSAV